MPRKGETPDAARDRVVRDILDSLCKTLTYELSLDAVHYAAREACRVAISNAYSAYGVNDPGCRVCGKFAPGFEAGLSRYVVGKNGEACCSFECEGKTYEVPEVSRLQRLRNEEP